MFRSLKRGLKQSQEDQLTDYYGVAQLNWKVMFLSLWKCSTLHDQLRFNLKHLEVTYLFQWMHTEDWPVVCFNCFHKKDVSPDAHVPRGRSRESHLFSPPVHRAHHRVGFPQSAYVAFSSNQSSPWFIRKNDESISFKMYKITKQYILFSMIGTI